MRNRNWLVIGLVVSIGANLALAGFVAGRLLQPGPAPAMLDPTFGLFRVIHQLPDARRDAFRATLRDHFGTLRGDLRRMREAQRGINDALEEEPFEPQDLDHALTAFREALIHSQRDNHAVLVQVATDMTPQERRELRDAMTRAARPPHGHHWRDGRDSERGDR